MELLVVRHAIAFERDRERWRDDRARPLSPDGTARARRAAAGLKNFIRAPDRLWTSPLTRARQTAQILTDVAGWPQAVDTAELSPGAPVMAVLALLAKVRHPMIAVVGHEPGLGILLAACLAGEEGGVTIEMKKNAVACVSFEGAPHAGQGALRWLATPRMLRAFR